MHNGSKKPVFYSGTTGADFSIEARSTEVLHHEAE
jgi:hypothetical protein